MKSCFVVNAPTHFVLSCVLREISSDQRCRGVFTQSQALPVVTFDVVRVEEEDRRRDVRDVEVLDVDRDRIRIHQMYIGHLREFSLTLAQLRMDTQR